MQNLLFFGFMIQMGKLKRRIRPSDITINIGKDAPVPECPIPGQRLVLSLFYMKRKRSKEQRCTLIKVFYFIF